MWENRFIIFADISILAECILFACSCSISVFAADKDTGRYANFWGRSVGWYYCALVDTLDWLEKDADREMLISIIREFIEVDEKAFLNLKDTVYVSGLGGEKLRDGSYDYYISEPKQINNLLGIGAFLMASVELEKI